MKIRWLNHACFLIENEAGKKVLCDPFDDRLGYPVPDVAVDVVTVSHGHFDHSYVEKIPAGYVLVDDAAPFCGDGFSIRAVDSFHDEQEGALRGANRIYVIEGDAIRVAHLGDLGHVPDDKLLALLGPVDVLMVPVGGFYTLDAAAAKQVVEAIAPAVTIPMHYRTTTWNDERIAPVEVFLALMGQAPLRCTQLELHRETMGEAAGLVVMEME